MYTKEEQKILNNLKAIALGEKKISIREFNTKYGVKSASFIKKGNLKYSKEVWGVSCCPATFCPSERKGFCKMGAFCYAKKQEHQYKKFLCYLKNLKAFHRASVEEIVAYIVQKDKNAKKHHLKALRVNINGDFIKSEDILKWDKIAFYLKKTLGVKVFAYTKRYDLLNTVRECKNININISEVKIDNQNSFIAIPKKEFKGLQETKEVLKCKCNNCLNCGYCLENKNKTIYCAIH